MQQHFGGMQWNKEKKGMRDKKKKRNIVEKLNGSGLQANSSIPFLKAAVMKMKAMLISK